MTASITYALVFTLFVVVVMLTVIKLIYSYYYSKRTTLSTISFVSHIVGGVGIRCSNATNNSFFLRVPFYDRANDTIRWVCVPINLRYGGG